MKQIKWLDQPEDQDYENALSFLSLIVSPPRAKKLITAFKKSDITRYKAKDLIRASGLPIVGRTDFHVARDLKKIQSRKAIAPVLLIRGEGSQAIPLYIADGYHRSCAVYWYDEDSTIDSLLVDWE